METSFNRKSKNKHGSIYFVRIGCLWMFLALFIIFLGFINVRDIRSFLDINISKNFKYRKKLNEAKKNGSSVFFSSIDGPINSKVKIYYDSFNKNGFCKIINDGSFKILNNRDLLMLNGPRFLFDHNLEDHIFIKYRLDEGSIELTRPNIIFYLVKDSKGFPIPMDRNVIYESTPDIGGFVPYGWEVWEDYDKKIYTKFDWYLFGNSKKVFVKYGINAKSKNVRRKLGPRTNEFSPKTINQIFEHFKYCEGKIKM